MEIFKSICILLFHLLVFLSSPPHGSHHQQLVGSPSGPAILLLQYWATIQLMLLKIILMSICPNTRLYHVCFLEHFIVETRELLENLEKVH